MRTISVVMVRGVALGVRDGEAVVWSRGQAVRFLSNRF